MTQKNVAHMHNICKTYQHHLQKGTVGDELRQQKIGIIAELMSCSTSLDIARLLAEPRCHVILKKRRTHYIWTAIEIILVVLTFPLAIPLLMLWSWTQRGDVNFLKTDGAIVVEKLLKLCAENPTPSLISTSTVLTCLTDAPDNSETHTPRAPHFNHSEGFQPTSAISSHALEKLGLFPEPNQYIHTDRIKKEYYKAVIAKHPDKTHSDTHAEFNDIQNAKEMLLKEEYNPDESAEDRSARRRDMLVNIVLPAVQKEQEKNQENVRALEASMQQIELAIAQKLESRQQQAIESTATPTFK